MRSKAEDVITNWPFEIEVAITLTKRPLKTRPFPDSWRPPVLSEAAYQQKVYHLRLEQGRFKVENRTTYGCHPMYEYRMTWDRSPYPPLEEWTNNRGVEAGKYWERKDFYKGELEGLE